MCVCASLTLVKKWIKQKSFVEKNTFKFSNRRDVISTYLLMTYVPTNIFTVQLPFTDCIEKH